MDVTQRKSKRPLPRKPQTEEPPQPPVDETAVAAVPKEAAVAVAAAPQQQMAVPEIAEVAPDEVAAPAAAVEVAEVAPDVESQLGPTFLPRPGVRSNESLRTAGPIGVWYREAHNKPRNKVLTRIERPPTDGK